MRADEVAEQLREFVSERDWDQFHAPENLAKSIAIEAGELLECFQWAADAPREQVIGELADVLTYCHLLAAKLDVDPFQAILDKLEKTKLKYPVDQARGNTKRPTDL
jgi:NTP pyrophosphatase (non-canonical NTP hydrolase)